MGDANGKKELACGFAFAEFDENSERQKLLGHYRVRVAPNWFGTELYLFLYFSAFGLQSVSLQWNPFRTT